MTSEFGNFCFIKHFFWEKCSHSNYSSITKRDFEQPISVKQAQTLLMILPTKIVLWVSLKIYEMQILVFHIYCDHAIVAPLCDLQFITEATNITHIITFNSIRLCLIKLVHLKLVHVLVLVVILVLVVLETLELEFASESMREVKNALRWLLPTLH